MPVDRPPSRPATVCRGVRRQVQQPPRDPRPAPALDGGRASGSANRGSVGGRKRRAAPATALRSAAASPVANDVRCASCGRIRGLETGCHLGQARVARDERRAAGCGRLGGDHAERLGEDRRHHASVGEGEQVTQVAVLERPGEQRGDAEVVGLPLERSALGAEADHHHPRLDPLERLQQHVHALLRDQLAEVDDRGRLTDEEPRQPDPVQLVGQALVRVPGVRRIVPRLAAAARRARCRAPPAPIRRRRPRAAPRGRARRDRTPPRAPGGCGPTPRTSPPRRRAPRPPTPRARRCRASRTRAPSRAP